MSPFDRRPSEQREPEGTLDRPPAEVVERLRELQRRLLDRIAERESKATDPQQDRCEP